VSDGIVLDYDKDGNLTGIDIDQASVKLNITELILNKLPAELLKLLKPKGGRFDPCQRIHCY
jgi:uncharacterized protein YuzE